MNTVDLMPIVFLLLVGMALSIGLGVIALLVGRGATQGSVGGSNVTVSVSPLTCFRSCLLGRPGRWLAIKSHNLRTVQSALGLHNPKPCSWLEGLAADEKLFIAPPVKGWILVIGSGLPDPSEDVDVCFRFLLDISRKLGQVQFFSASPILHHHAWVRADRGHVQRAYAWAG